MTQDNIVSFDGFYVCTLCGCLVHKDAAGTHFGLLHRNYCTMTEYIEMQPLQDKE